MKRLEVLGNNLSRPNEVFYKSSHVTESSQERMIFEVQRIRDFGHRLHSLADSKLENNGSARGSVLTSSVPNVNQDHQKITRLEASLSMQSKQVDRLKHQNKMLTEEVSKKSNVITSLEQEKSLLIRQLFEARAGFQQGRPGQGFNKPGNQFDRNSENVPPNGNESESTFA